MVDHNDREGKDDKEKSPYFVIQSVDRTLNILECFIREGRPLGVSEIARQLGLNRSAAHRFMMTLQMHGYLQQSRETEKYMVGPKAFELGAVYTNSTDLTVEGKKLLIELVGRTDCTAHLAILDQGSVLYLVNVEPDQRAVLFGAVGQRAPFYRTGLGKSLTAWLPKEQLAELLADCKFEKLTENTILSAEQYEQELERVRQDGYSMDREESSIGMRCFAAPIRNRRNEVIAAISISGYGIAEDRSQEYALAVMSSAAQLSRRLGMNI